MVCPSASPAPTWCRPFLTRLVPNGRWPAVEVVGTYSPPLGFEKDETENAAILSRIATARPEVLIVGLGAPKQELWVHKHQTAINAKVALCVGATIDFLAGERSRAPVWMREAGLEWAYRIFTEPRRLAARYAKDALIFPRILAREWWRRRHPSPAGRGWGAERAA